MWLFTKYSRPLHTRVCPRNYITCSDYEQHNIAQVIVGFPVNQFSRLVTSSLLAGWQNAERLIERLATVTTDHPFPSTGSVRFISGMVRYAPSRHDTQIEITKWKRAGNIVGDTALMRVIGQLCAQPVENVATTLQLRGNLLLLITLSWRITQAYISLQAYSSLEIGLKSYETLDPRHITQSPGELFVLRQCIFK